MSGCCAMAGEHKPNQLTPVCPACSHKGSTVGVKTMLQHIRQPWLYELTEESYYFCAQPDCDVVYFSMNAKPIKHIDLRTRVGSKEQSVESLICYCFGVKKAEARADPAIKGFVIQQTKNGMCVCETANPSGKCCLKDFPT